MHIAVRVAAFVLGAIIIVGAWCQRADAWPARGDSNVDGRYAVVQLAGDTCWWWGPRWQYGWRGYGWYTCLDEAKPAAPVAIAPESVPEDAVVMPEPCLRTWRDKSGKLRSRRIC